MPNYPARTAAFRERYAAALEKRDTKRAGRRVRKQARRDGRTTGGGGRIGLMPNETGATLDPNRTMAHPNSAGKTRTRTASGYAGAIRRGVHR